MKKIILSLVLVLLIFSCSNNTEYILPTFKPLDNTEDIVLIENARDSIMESELLAIDTNKNEVRQIYKYGKGYFTSLVRFTKNNICYFSVGNKLISLNTLTGKNSLIYTDPIWVNCIENENLLFTNDYNHKESYSYDPKTNKLTQFYTYGAISPGIIKINDCSYCVTYIGNLIDPLEKIHYTIYDITNEKEIKLTYGLDPFEIFCNKYLISEDRDNGGYVLHEIISFEPENLRYIGKVGMADDVCEDDLYIYVSVSDIVKKIRKSDNIIVAKSESIPNHESCGLTVFKNGYAWLGAGQESGDYYRIETKDDDGDGVLNWELVKYNK